MHPAPPFGILEPSRQHPDGSTRLEGVYDLSAFAHYQWFQHSLPANCQTQPLGAMVTFQQCHACPCSIACCSQFSVDNTSSMLAPCCGHALAGGTLLICTPAWCVCCFYLALTPSFSGFYIRALLLVCGFTDRLILQQHQLYVAGFQNA